MIDSLVKQKESLIIYLNSKVIAQDWHAVQDAASDIREIEAQIKLLSKLKTKA